MNIQHLKIFELHHKSKSTALTYKFPNSKQDFDLLKLLGADKTFKKFEIQKVFGKIRRTVGVELEF